MPCTVSMTCQASRCCRLATTSALYSVASSRTRSSGSTSAHEVGLDPQRRTGTGHAAADPGPATGAQHGGRCTAGEAAHLLDRGDHAVGRITVAESRREQQITFAAAAGGVDGGLGGLVELDRHDHSGQYDEIGNEKDWQTTAISHEKSPRKDESDRLNLMGGGSIPQTTRVSRTANQGTCRADPTGLPTCGPGTASYANMGQVVGISPSAAARIRRVGPVEILIGLLVVIFALQPVLVGLFDGAAVQAWSTVFVAVVVQAVPFLVLGVVVSALIATYVPASFFRRVLPRSTMAAVPAAGLAGAVLPGCECASVPISARLISREVPPAAALAFLLSAPAINPVVLVATAVAFPGRPEVVAARFAASLGAAVIVGWIWARFGRAKWTAAAKGSAEEPETRPAGGDLPRRGPARFPAVRRLPRHRRADVGHPQHRRTAVDPRLLQRPRVAGGAGTRPARGDPGDLFRGRCLRRLQPHPVLADRPARLPGGRADGRRQTDRDAGGHLRPGVRGAVRPAGLRRRDRHLDRGGAVVAV